MVFSGQLQAKITHWSVTQNNFTGQRDIDKAMSFFNTRSMATINYGDMVYDFVNYREGLGAGSIQLRILTNTPGSVPIQWSNSLQSNITNLTNLGAYDWQPAPVVFNDNLYLFVGDKTHGISYSVYNLAAKTWSALTQIYCGGEKLGCGMAAIVVGDKLCVVFLNNTAFMNVCWTSDLVTWNSSRSQTFGRNKPDGTCDAPYSQISAISKAYIDGGKRKEKLMYGYIDQQKRVNFSTCIIDDNNNFKFLSNIFLATGQYQSVAIAQGTVYKDASSKGDCLQAFVKLDKQDNGFIRFRIQRFQSTDNGVSWNLSENNLVKQNYLWASHDVNLCIVNYAIPDGKDIQQYMCLFYRVYDDWDYPLDCAWAETDRLHYNSFKDKNQILSGVQNTQYVGYVEGPPPYHLNDSAALVQANSDIYLNPNALDVSDISVEASTISTSDKEFNCDATGEVNFKVGWFKAGTTTTIGKAMSNECTQTSTWGPSIISKEVEKGYYLTQSPQITRSFYEVISPNDPTKVIDSIYYFHMSNIQTGIEEVNLTNGLIPSDPKTYINRNVNFPAYNNSQFGTMDSEWLSNPWSSSKAFDQSNSQTTSLKVTLSVGADLGEMFDVGIEGSLEYSVSTTMNSGMKIEANTRLNKAVAPTDVTDLKFTTYWLKPLSQDAVGPNPPPLTNWWLHPGALDQNTWCVTYDVTKVIYMNGSSSLGMAPARGDSTVILPKPNGAGINRDSLAKKGATQVPLKGFLLTQNYPNPFRSATLIKYQVGQSDQITKTSNQEVLVKMVVYDLNGLEVATLVDALKAPGSYEVEWTPSELLPGVYFYSLQSGSFRDIKKFVLLK